MNQFVHFLFVVFILLTASSQAEPGLPTEAEMAEIRAKVARMNDEFAGRSVDNVIYRDVTIIDGTGQVSAPGMAIIVHGEKIVQILPDSTLTNEQLTTHKIYQADGAWLLPGLIDVHVHYSQVDKVDEPRLSRLLYSGVTAVRDMWGDGRTILWISKQAFMNRISSPDIFYSALMAGSQLLDPGRNNRHGENMLVGYGVNADQAGWAQLITKDTDIRAAVLKAVGLGVTGIKVYSGVNAEQLDQIISIAKEYGVLVWGHSNVMPASPFETLQMNTVSHMCSTAAWFASTKKEREEMSYNNMQTPETYEGISIVGTPEFKQYIQEAKAAGTIIDPTLILQEVFEGEWVVEHRGEPMKKFWAQNCPRQLVGEMTAALHQAGVRIAAGSDTFSKWDNHFPAIYEELESLVKDAELSPHDAIIAATSNAAAVIGKEKSMGTISVGKLASFILVKDDPTEDITNLRSIHLTVKRGRQFPRADYQHSIEKPEYGF